MAGTIALNPAVKDSQNWLKVRIPRGTYSRNVNTSVAKDPSTNASEDEQFANAVEIASNDSY